MRRAATPVAVHSKREDPVRLRTHGVILTDRTAAGAEVRLRPLTEDDWPLLYAWNADPEVLYYSEGADVERWEPGQVRMIYRTVSQHAFCFIIEYDGSSIGECWLEEMNLQRVLDMFPGQDIRRIDLMIGEKGFWGMGIGTEAIRLLTDFGFRLGTQAIYIPDVAGYNLASLRAFQKAGYSVVCERPHPAGSKAPITYDLIRFPPACADYL